MKELFRYGLILAFICIISSGLLAGMHKLTASKIIAQAEAKEKSILQELFPEFGNFEGVESAGEIVYYKVLDKSKKLMGFAFKAQGKGYSSAIESMAALTPAGDISGIKILSQNETPGLGNRINEPSFLGKFTNKTISELNGIDGITGATISSKAVVDSVRKKAEEIKKLIENEK